MSPTRARGDVAGIVTDVQRTESGNYRLTLKNGAQYLAKRVVSIGEEIVEVTLTNNRVLTFVLAAGLVVAATAAAWAELPVSKEPSGSIQIQINIPGVIDKTTSQQKSTKFGFRDIRQLQARPATLGEILGTLGAGQTVTSADANRISRALVLLFSTKELDAFFDSAELLIEQNGFSGVAAVSAADKDTWLMDWGNNCGIICIKKSFRLPSRTAEQLGLRHEDIQDVVSSTENLYLIRGSVYMYLAMKAGGYDIRRTDAGPSISKLASTGVYR